MLKFMKDAKGAASFRAVTKNEMDVCVRRSVYSTRHLL